MRREFLGIYQQLYTDYQRAETRPLQFPGLPGPPRQLVAEAMEQARNEIKPRVVRPDAIYFIPKRPFRRFVRQRRQSRT